jgi:hypothetical protein
MSMTLYRRMATVFLVAWMAGCGQPAKDRPIWEQVKIGEIGAKGGDHAQAGLNTTNLDIHVFQVPAAKVKQLHGMWDALNAKPYRYRNYQAFRSNAFRAAKCSLQQWDWVLGSLKEVGADQTATLSVWLSGDEDNDVAISPVPRAQQVSFSDAEGRRAQVTVGPGRLSLRLNSSPMTRLGQARQLVGCPVFTVAASGALTRLTEMAKAREVPFWGAAFSIPIKEGDVLVLGPEDYYGDTSTLGGLFFWDPQGALVVEAGKPHPVQRRPAIRVFVIVCTRLSEGAP